MPPAATGGFVLNPSIDGGDHASDSASGCVILERSLIRNGITMPMKMLAEAASAS